MVQSRFVTVLCCLLVVVTGLLPGKAHANPPNPPEPFKALWWDTRTPDSPWPPVAPDAESLESPSLVPADVAAWTRIAFASYRNNNWEIYLARGDGTQPMRLTNHPATDQAPSLTRGSTQLVFASTRNGSSDIFRMNSDGSGLQLLAGGDRVETAPAWAPNGQRVAYARKMDESWEIYVINANGSGATRLTQDEIDDVDPTWSPDGTQIAWVRYTNGNAGAIWTMNANGTNAHALSSACRYMQNLSWSPDGLWIAYDCDQDGDYWNEVLAFRVDQGYSNTIHDPGGSLVDAWMGNWKHDGSALLFSRIEYVVQNDRLYINHAYIEQVAWSGGSVTRLIASGLDLAPEFQIADLAPPVSQVAPLPPHSRARGFTVAWSGNDVGPAGITSYDVQYRAGASTIWLNWLMATTATTAPFDLVPPGQTVYLRVRARDEAGNTEAWRPGPNGDTATMLYAAMLNGLVTDHRGVPIPDSVVFFQPEPAGPVETNLRGRFEARLLASGSHTVAARHDGYSAALPAPLTIESDGTVNVNLKPPDNLILNGDFEASSDLTGWRSEGGTAATVSPTIRRTGQQAARLGVSCVLPCLTDPVTVPGGGYAYSALAADSQGNLHRVWDGSEPDQGRGTYYAWRTRAGVWSTPVRIGAVVNYSYGNMPAVTVDGRDTVHAAWTSGDGLYYAQKPSGGTWSSPQRFSEFAEAGIALEADTTGNIHCLYWAEAIVYRQRRSDGTWLAPLVVDDQTGIRFSQDLALTADGTVHMLWQRSGEGGIFYRARYPDGIWSSVRQIFSGFGYSYDRQRLVTARDGTLHAFWTWAYSGYYASKPPGGAWSAPVALSQARGPSDLTVDSQGTVHLISSSGLASDEKTYYRQKPLGGPWTNPIVIHDDYHSYPTLVVDRFDRVHTVWESWNSIKYQTSESVSTSALVSLSQVVSIPPAMHRPTLALAYQLNGIAPGSRSGFVVLVEANGSTNQVFATTTSAPWAFTAQDLSAWVGQTVTVTLALRQQAADPAARLYLDDVVLGSWWTPRLHQIMPVYLPPRTATTITLVGENFAATPSVNVGDTQLTDVEWVDAQTLRARLPASLEAGAYRVRITNPGGQESVALAGLIVGGRMFLPGLRQ